MAEYILRDLAGDRFEAFSAGIKPAGQIHPLTFHILKKNFNINARRARSKTWDEFLNRKFDLVFTLCRKDRETCPYWEGQSQLTHRDITDPEADNTDDLRRLMFIAVAKEIRDRLKEFCRPLDPKIAPYRVLPRSSKQSPPPPR
jgi:protein-tyrosine-phosphatase